MIEYSRHVSFESILNFRDLGGYRTQGGRMLAWRRLFRSGELHHMTGHDAARLKEEIRLASVIDLRSSRQGRPLGLGLLEEVGVKYFNIPFIKITEDDYNRERREAPRDFANSGDFYLYFIRQEEFDRRLMEALGIIADPANHPLVFHCNAGKDRSGILAAVILGVLGVADDDIVEDYMLTAPYMEQFLSRWDNASGTADISRPLPDYITMASPESMVWFLSALKQEYGSIRGYLETQGAEKGLFDRLERALLV